MELLTQVKDLSRIGYGFMASKALFSALDLEIFSRLADGALSAQEIEHRRQAAPNGLHTLLRACTSLGLIGLEGGRYVNSPAAAAYLDVNAPLYFGDYFRYQIDRQIYPSMQELGDALHGKPTTPMYARMESPGEAELFSQAQHVGSLGPTHLLAGRVDASAWTRLLAVAGGSGAFCIARTCSVPCLQTRSRRSSPRPSARSGRAALSWFMTSCSTTRGINPGMRRSGSSPTLSAGRGWSRFPRKSESAAFFQSQPIQPTPGSRK